MQAEGHIFSLYSGVLARLKKERKRTLLICKLQKSKCFVIVIGIVAISHGCHFLEEAIKFWLEYVYNFVFLRLCSVNFCFLVSILSLSCTNIFCSELQEWSLFFFFLICNEDFIYDLKVPLLKRVILKVFLVFCS